MKKTFLFVLCCCAINLIYAQNIVKEHYTVSGGLLGAANFSQFRITNDNPNNIDYETKTGWSAGGWVNFPVSNNFSIEPQVMHSSYRYLTNSTANVLLKDGNITYISVPLLLKFGLSDKFAITAGPQVDFMSKVKNNTGSTAQENDFNQTSFSGFAGLEILPHGRVTLFGRYIHGFSNMNEKNEAQPLEYKNQNIQAGLKLKLFGKKVPADSDGDGVSDPNDKCPNVIGLARYDGCPIPDTDGDGINDELDKCPGQAGTAKYDGCPVPDRDGDGINDELDKCPDVAGIAANDGCPETKGEVSDKLTRVVNTNAQNIVFTGTTVTLMTKSNASLNNIVKILNENPDLKAKIEGHTDNAGDDAKNMTLSTNRAEAVKTYLVNKGISADRITTEGFGETMPIADNTTAAGRTKNRRVEIKLMY